MTDKVYLFNKRPNYAGIFSGIYFGENQLPFNMSFVIDGTKDSCQVVVWSNQETEIEPYSLIYHPSTDSSWIVSHDKVERYANEQGTFIYVHNLELIGAIELLNARDLTDCGFNDNKYTISSFIRRLFSLSNFEYDYSSPSFIEANANFLNKKVEFIKTFENYTLLSALRELLDAFNMTPKLNFYYNYNSTTDRYTIDRPYLKIVPKNGGVGTVHNISEFDDVRETKTMDKNSFGTCVVSNAENVISSLSKTFPATGGVKTSSKEYLIKPENAIIRLPSNVWKANWLALIGSRAPVEVYYSVGTETGTINQNTNGVNPLQEKTWENALDYIYEVIEAADYATFNPSGEVGKFFNPFKQALEAAKDQIFAQIKKASTIRLYDGFDVNPVNGSVVQGSVPYLVHVDYISRTDENNRLMLFTDKRTRETLPQPWKSIYWERGSNEISGFDGFKPDSGRQPSIQVVNYINTDLQSNTTIYTFFQFSNADGTVIIRTPAVDKYTIHFRDNAQWIVNYVPMGDLKLKVDNTRNENDIQLYNQNGKITDNIALSKLINSYSKEISSDTITRFKCYYDYDSVPKVGETVQATIDGKLVEYVINNMSLSFSQNELSDYFIECEITMSKFVSTKSLLVNPNSNIRDYGIPQNYNVKRKQLYRDFYELTYDLYSDANLTTPYVTRSTVFTFSHEQPQSFEYMAVMKLTYSDLVGGSLNWYYQLESTKYIFNKMIYVVVDFNDNNIIGYGSQNVWSGFDITRVFTGMVDNLNTPISYVDGNGEFVGCDLILIDNFTIASIYNEYEEENSDATGYQDFINKGGTLYNYSVFIPAAIYNYSIAYANKIRIMEPNYNKDALEVPVFEYACQIDDSEDVFIGDNFFNIKTNTQDTIIYFYSYVTGHNLTQDNVVNTNTIVDVVNPIGFRINNGVEIEYLEPAPNVQYPRLRVKLYATQTYVVETKEWVNNQQRTFEADQDYAIFRHGKNLRTGEQTSELLFIMKNVPSSSIVSGNGILSINYYKLK
ncbi:MAG: hypothetical protein J6S85_17985 [Methanobrevibacter sp.]|nr:hypothetical protein [Methanobrevibacter sp.]